MIAEYVPRINQGDLAAAASTALLVMNLNSTVAFLTDAAAVTAYLLRTPISDAYKNIMPARKPDEAPIS